MPNLGVVVAVFACMCHAVAAFANQPAQPIHTHFQQREMLLDVPNPMPAPAQRRLIVVLHGGGGNARFMRKHLNLSQFARQYATVVAYASGTQAMALFPRLKSWNAGKGCCGRPYRQHIDDVQYLQALVKHLQQQYHISPAQTYAVGHSNGAMMLQRLMCESTLFRKAVSLAGTQMTEKPQCPHAKGREMISYHGTDDANVPLHGGHGSKAVTHLFFPSQAEAKQVFENADGVYRLHALKGAEHSIDAINQALLRQTGSSLVAHIASNLGLTQ